MTACSSGSSAACAVRRAYRQLLSAVDLHLTRVAGNTLWRSHVAAQFRRNAGLTDPQQIQAQLALAQDYHHLLSNIAEHQRLLQSYNIGLADDERTKQMVEAVSKRMGFKLPTHHHEQQQQQQQQQ